MIFEHVKCLPDFCVHVSIGDMEYTSCQPGPANLQTHGPNHGLVDNGQDKSKGLRETNPRPPPPH